MQQMVRGGVLQSIKTCPAFKAQIFHDIVVSQMYTHKTVAYNM